MDTSFDTKGINSDSTITYTFDSPILWGLYITTLLCHTNLHVLHRKNRRVFQPKEMKIALLLKSQITCLNRASKIVDVHIMYY